MDVHQCQERRGRAGHATRTDRPADADIDAYSTAVVIKWEYPRLPGTASPPADALQEMEVFGEAVVGLSRAAGCSYLMNVGTGLGSRQWVYYTRDRDEFMRRFNAMLGGLNHFPVQIEFYDDPGWKVSRDLRVAYERTGGPPPPRPNALPSSRATPGSSPASENGSAATPAAERRRSRDGRRRRG